MTVYHHIGYTMLTKVWEWLKKHWKWLLVLPALVVGILAWRKGGSIASAILGKDKPTPPPPGTTLTKKEAKAEREEVNEEVAVAKVKLEAGRVDGHRDFDEWLRRGGADAKPPRGGTK